MQADKFVSPELDGLMCYCHGCTLAETANSRSTLARSQSVSSTVLIANCPACLGDQSMHQLWRMHHGEIFQKHQPHIAIVMIGTNDLGAASCLGKGEAPILQAAAGTADRCNCIYLHSRMDSLYSLTVSLQTLDTQLLANIAAVVRLYRCCACKRSTKQSARLIFGTEHGSQQTINKCNVYVGWNH